ncbi:MAG: hypothetical protein K1X65_19970 [Caldilineales bacterium]|nr:hypothetical protein [Caldilineales bacterium]MCW5857079.1 hypothetical protein [Caldilineales bacterium]
MNRLALLSLRYGFVIGDKERLGGDIAFGRKLKAYWTPVEQPASEQKPAGVGCGARHR